METLRLYYCGTHRGETAVAPKQTATFWGSPACPCCGDRMFYVPAVEASRAEVPVGAT